MTDDDTKFERARRERPHIEAFATITPSPPTPPRQPRPPEHLSLGEMLEDWARADQARGVPREQP